MKLSEAMTVLNAQKNITLVRDEKGEFLLQVPFDKKHSITPQLDAILGHFGGYMQVGATSGYAELHVTFQGKEQINLKKLVDAGLKVKDADEYLEYDRVKAKQEMLQWLVEQSHEGHTQPVSVELSHNTFSKDREVMHLKLEFHQPTFDEKFASKPYALHALKQTLIDFGAESVYDKTPAHYSKGSVHETRDETTTLSIIAKDHDGVKLDLLKLSEAGVSIPGIEHLKAAFKAPSTAPEKPTGVPVHPPRARAVE